MTDIGKAIEILSETQLQYMYSIPDCMNCADEDTVEASESNQNVVDAIDLAIQALEKQISKKIINEKVIADLCNYYLCKCPNCLEHLSNYCISNKSKHCPDCGQKIDWSEKQ